MIMLMLMNMPNIHTLFIVDDANEKPIILRKATVQRCINGRNKMYRTILEQKVESALLF
jgi:hypothetical protein